MATIGEEVTTGWHAIGNAATAALDKLDVTSTSTLIAAVLGGLIAASASYFVQQSAVKAARKEREAAKYVKDIADAFTLLAKVVKMFSVFRAMRGVIAEAVARFEDPHFNPHRPWETLQPMATLPTEVTLSPEEVAFLLGTKVNSIILKGLELVDVCNDLLQMLRLYSDKRAVFIGALPPVIIDGRIDVAPMDKETSLRMAPLTVPLSNLFFALVERINGDYQQAEMVFQRLRAHCFERFGKDFPRLEVIEEATPVKDGGATSVS